MDSKVDDFTAFMDQKTSVLTRLKETQPIAERFTRAVARARLEVRGLLDLERSSFLIGHQPSHRAEESGGGL